MNILSWNCQGLGNLHAISILKDLIWNYRPNVILLFETLYHVNKIQEIRVKLGYDFSFAVDRDGRGGGIAILWKHPLNYQIINYSENFINVKISDDAKGPWWLKGFYDFPERSRRRESWKSLRNLAFMSIIPWCIIGDFNDLLMAEYKKGRI